MMAKLRSCGDLRLLHAIKEAKATCNPPSHQEDLHSLKYFTRKNEWISRRLISSSSWKWYCQFFIIPKSCWFVWCMWASIWVCCLKLFPWYKDNNRKNKTKNLERYWCHSKVTVDHELYVNQCNFVNKLISEAQISFYSKFILDAGFN